MYRYFFLLPMLASLFAQAQVRINELQCTRWAGSDGRGLHGDWVELYNAGEQRVDLAGYVLSMNGQLHVLRQGLNLMPGACIALWCDKAPELGPEHLDMNLSRKGGSLLLVAPDRSTVLDLFHWPALPQGVSMGRSSDGGRAWGYFVEPSPGKPNAGAAARLLPAPVITVHGAELAMAGADGASIRYTLNGSKPDLHSARYRAPLRVPSGTVVTARSFATDGVPSPCAMYSTGVPASAWAVTLAPDDLVGPDGIADVPSGNRARKGRRWQRQAWLQQGDEVFRVGLAISGNGSRSLPKHNFKLLVRDRFVGDNPVPLPDGSAWRELILRADGTPHAFLRNTFMKAVARQSGGRVDVQPSYPMHLFLNGQDQGLFRAMPAKGKEWVRSLNGGAPVELIEGPGVRVVSGGAEHYEQMQQALLGGASLDSLEQCMDVESLVELACFDLWTGRADHELNVRCWRPQKPGGRWRWILFDMDLWAPPEDRTVRRMCSAPTAETPYLPILLADPGMRDRLLARFAALLATTLAPDRAALTADSLFLRNRSAMMHDHALWKDRMEMPSPEAMRTRLLAHIGRRNRPLLEQLAKQTGKAIRSVTVEVYPAKSGQVLVEALPFTEEEREMKVFTGVPLHLEALAAPGMEFTGWKGAAGEGAKLIVSPRGNLRVTAVFAPVAVSRQGGLEQRME